MKIEGLIVVDCWKYGDRSFYVTKHQKWGYIFYYQNCGDSKMIRIPDGGFVYKSLLERIK